MSDHEHDWYDDLGPPGPVYQMADGVPCPESDRVTAILTDLIAELRDMGESTFDGFDHLITPALDRAERRLREVTGDE